MVEDSEVKEADNAAAQLADATSATTAFDCNICIEQAKDPVVTVCGHLYCWSCLYRWMQVQNSSQSCPVCKAGIETDKIIPIYGRGCDQTDPRKNLVVLPPQEAIPRRPAGHRPLPVQRFVGQDASFSVQPLGIIPTLLGYQQPHGQRDPLTPEQQHQMRQGGQEKLKSFYFLILTVLWVLYAACL